jgi:histidinol-phosphate aminotransferase
VAGIRAYQVPRHGAPIDLPLDGNEGPIQPLDLATVLGGDPGAVANRYPSARRFQEQWAARLGVGPEQVRVTAGADEALDRITRTFVGPGREMLTTEPTFEMLPRYCALAGGRYVTVPWPSGPFPIDAMLARVSPRTSLVAVVSPNNPTGAVATIDDVQRLAAAAPTAVVLVDLAYAEFADVDPVREVLDLPNTLVTRTLSKAWGLAGLRVGCAAGPADLIAWLAPAGNPYPVSGVSIALASAALAHGDRHMTAAVARIRREREALSSLLAALGAEPAPSQANFVLATFGDAGWAWDGLAGLGIAVRRFPDRPGLEGALRIACPGEPAAFDRLAAALRAVLRPEALLFDLDGVLADVSQSFPEAVRATAAAYGVDVTRADIGRAKAAGGANNDWILTRRLMAERGVDRGLAEVTDAFERIYLGTAGTRGLCQTERCVVERAWLERLAARYPLGIVTGRTREDAERFLDRAGIRDLFRALVTMHDAPEKPDPAPVRLALAQLGVESAWMVGDTPDDVRAARAAGVVPLGIVAPGADDTVMRPALVGAGAARLIADVRDVEGMLP